MHLFPGYQALLPRLGRAHSPLPGLYVEHAADIALAPPGAISRCTASGYHELPGDASLWPEKSSRLDTGNRRLGLSQISGLYKEKADIILDRSPPQRKSQLHPADTLSRQVIRISQRMRFS